MRSFVFLAALAIFCAAPRWGLAQPRPSDPDPEERIGPSFELPDPNNVAPLNSRPVPQFPTPNYGNRSAPATPAPPALLAPEPSIAPRMETLGPAVVEQPIYAGPISAAPQDMPPQISPNAEKWRYKFSEGRWWYNQPSGRWSYWSDGRWVEYSSSRYANTPAGVRPPVPQRRWPLGRRVAAQPAYAPPPSSAYGPNGGAYGPTGGPYGPTGGAYGPTGGPAYSPGYYGPAGGAGVY